MPIRSFRLASTLGIGLLAAAAGLFGAGSAQAAQVSCTPSAGFNTCVQFTYSGTQQSFTVPAGVTSLDATLLGGDGTATATGGQASGTIAVTPGQTLTVTVGQFSGPFGGGGPGAGVAVGCTQLCGRDGGGMSALWNGAPNVAANALLIAGGGGGRGGRAADGGVGGGLTGGAGGAGASDAGGGTQSAGGAGGTVGCAAGDAGSQFQGGAGAGGPNGGGGGGGGWFGGGGGFCAALNGTAGSGGGGSSYISGPGVTNGTTTAGANAPNSDGLVTLQFNVPVVDTPLVNWTIASLAGALVLGAGCTIAVRRRRNAN